MQDGPGFQIIDHTADIGLRAQGKTLADAFASAAQGAGLCSKVARMRPLGVVKG